jgi:hypothetical protein
MEYFKFFLHRVQKLPEREPDHQDHQQEEKEDHEKPYPPRDHGPPGT